MSNAQPLVYLAGPITGLSYKGSVEWRNEVIKDLAAAGITGISPMRCKYYLERLSEISGHGREYVHMSPLSGPRGVVTRDFFDVRRADVILVNLHGADRVSIGTMFELAWAFERRTPIVCVAEKQNHPHDHMFVWEAIGYRVETMAEAVDIVKAILLPSDTRPLGSEARAA